MCEINCSGGCVDCAPEEHCLNRKKYREMPPLVNGCQIPAGKDYDWSVCPCDHFDSGDDGYIPAPN